MRGFLTIRMGSLRKYYDLDKEMLNILHKFMLVFFYLGTGKKENKILGGQGRHWAQKMFQHERIYEMFPPLDTKICYLLSIIF